MTGPGARTVIGVMDVGGGHVTAALVDVHDLTRTVADATVELDPHAGRDDLLDALVAPAATLVGDAATAVGGDAAIDQPLRWAVALPGPFDYARGSGTFAGVDKFRSLAGIDLGAELGERLRAPVRFLNDAVAYGIGEWAVGAGERASRVLCITLGTGVGSAFLHDGHEVDTGDTVPSHGEVHRLEIDGRPLEETVSSPALRSRYARLTGQERSVEQICAAARSGDVVAAEVVGDAMAALGTALAPWVGRFVASRVVVGGAVARSWDVIGEPLRRAVVGAAGPRVGVDVVPGTLGPAAPLLGAAAWASSAPSAASTPSAPSTSARE